MDHLDTKFYKRFFSISCDISYYVMSLIIFLNLFRTTYLTVCLGILWQSQRKYYKCENMYFINRMSIIQRIETNDTENGTK